MKRLTLFFAFLLACVGAFGVGPYNGTWVGGGSPTYVSGASGFGQAVSFLSSSNTITVNPDASISGQPWTISFRFNSTSAFATAIQLGGAGNSDGISIEGGQVLFAWSSFQGFTAGTSGQYNDSAWHTVEMDAKPATGDVYCFIDGTLVHHDTNLNATATDKISTIGGNSLTCIIDEVAWFNNTLLHTANYTPNTGPWANSTAGLDALWHLDGNLNDSTGSGISAGTVSPVVRGTTTYNLAITAAVGNTGTVNQQWQRAPDVAGSPGSYSNVGISSTALTLSDTGLSAGTKYWYHCNQTDSLATATSSAISVTTKAAGETPFVCIGDSITHGYQNTTPAVQNPVFHLANIFTTVGIQANNSNAIRIIEYQESGITGSASGDWLTGGTNFNAAVAAGDLLGATNYSVMLGANDAFASVSSSTYTAHMTNLVNGLTARGYTVELQCCYYIGGETAFIPQYNADLLTLVDNVHVFAGDTTAYALWQTNNGAFAAGAAGSWYQSDNLHPTPLGADILGGLWARSIGQAIGVNLGGGGNRIIGEMAPPTDEEWIEILNSGELARSCRF